MTGTKKRTKEMQMRNLEKRALGLLGAAILASQAFQAGFCDDSSRNFIKDTDDIGKARESGVVISNQMIELGMISTNLLRLDGEQCIRVGNIERAIKVLQRAVETEPLDMDGRVLYATALEKKLMKQKAKSRDPKLYNFCIKQWYYVAKECEFEDQKTQALKHLQVLTGNIPGRFDRNGKFLKKNLIAEDGSVKVPLGGKEKKEKDPLDELGPM
jgi:hypothetical protein